MLTTFIYGPRDVRVEDRPRPTIVRDDDAIVRVVASCVCGSDLWPYRGIAETSAPHGIGHEAIGVVEEVGTAVTSTKTGDFVIIPFSQNCGACQACRAGCPASCDHVTFTGADDGSGRPQPASQSEYVRVPMAQPSLFPIGFTETEVAERGLAPHLLTLADVMSTGYHAARGAQVGFGDVVAVVGDGAVGLCAVIAARMLGAKTVIAMSRHEDRAALARRFGADLVVPERGAAAPDAVRAVLGGDLADVALECVGTRESMDQALAIVRGGGRVGFVGVPHGDPVLNVWTLFDRNISIGGGMASSRRWMELLLPAVLDGTITPGAVFDKTLPLAEAAQGYAAMDARQAVKVLLTALPKVVSATRTIAAGADALFELIADPARQPEWDGNDNLANAAHGQRVHGVGEVFVMTTTKGKARENHVVEFEEGRRIAWQPASPGQAPAGHLWRWVLQSLPNGQTRVTHTYDWTGLTDPARVERARWTTANRLMASVDRLANLAETGDPRAPALVPCV